MSRIVLIHWNEVEAKERAGRLRAAGHVVVPFSDQEGGSPALRRHLGKPAHAIVIDLSRLPSHGRAMAIFLRQAKATRSLPLVFVGGDPEKVTRLRRDLPDATYTEWSRIRGDLRKALSRPTGKPVVPDAPDYSGTPLAKKLGIKEGATVALLGAPDGFEESLAPLPDGVSLRSNARGKADTVILFSRSRAEMRKHFRGAAKMLGDRGNLWISWPKKASDLETDLTQQDVRSYGLDQGLVDYKICAVDETWSGLCFARRRLSGKGGKS
jgi:hypothetical protein